MRIEVVYAQAQQQWLRALDVPEGASVAEVWNIAKDLPEFAHINLAEHAFGVFGGVCELSRVLKAGDRLEIYRPLLMDAKTARRLRAQQQKHSKA